MKKNNYYQIDEEHDLNDLLEMGLITDFAAFCEGNIFKYIYRHRNKNGKEDLIKARTYLDRLIEHEYGNKEMDPDDPLSRFQYLLEQIRGNYRDHD